MVWGIKVFVQIAVKVTWLTDQVENRGLPIIHGVNKEGQAALEVEVEDEGLAPRGKVAPTCDTLEEYILLIKPVLCEFVQVY